MAKNQPLDLLALSNRLSQGDAGWQAGPTTITTLTEDQREVRLGVPLPDDADPAQDEQLSAMAARSAAQATAESVGAPASFDLRNISGTNYVTAVRDQGGCGSCVAFGVAATMEHVARYSTRRPALPVDLSEAHLFFCHGPATGASCGTGWWPDRATRAAADQGVTFEDYFPYTPNQQACAVNSDWRNHLVKVAGWKAITGDAAAMKAAISTYGSVTACLYVYQDFFSYRTGVYRHVSGELAGGHCVTLLGYDDAGGYWIGKNSWGTGWGDGGFFKIAYGQCRIESYQTVTVEGVSFRTWWPNDRITGLWSNNANANTWAYAERRGWLKLDGANPVTANAMLLELAAAKAGGRPVGLFEDSSSVKQLYAW